MAWEYKVVAMGLTEEQLNELGEQGWELVFSEHRPASYPNPYRCVFKRKKIEVDA